MEYNVFTISTCPEIGIAAGSDPRVAPAAPCDTPRAGASTRPRKGGRASVACAVPAPRPRACSAPPPSLGDAARPLPLVHRAGSAHIHSARRWPRSQLFPGVAASWSERFGADTHRHGAACLTALDASQGESVGTGDEEKDGEEDVWDPFAPCDANGHQQQLGQSLLEEASHAAWQAGRQSALDPSPDKADSAEESEQPQPAQSDPPLGESVEGQQASHFLQHVLSSSIAQQQPQPQLPPEEADDTDVWDPFAPQGPMRDFSGVKYSVEQVQQLWKSYLQAQHEDAADNDVSDSDQ
eukprot:scaffold97_cov375-Prasinococcus_capsulatus_cf.AAC.3